jgi:hypothetical protein
MNKQVFEELLYLIKIAKETGNKEMEILYKKEYRRKLRSAQKTDNRKIVFKGDSSFDEIYDYEFIGSKRDLYCELWNGARTTDYHDYDGSGKHFTIFFMVGDKGNGIWRVRERVGISV